MNIKTKFFRYMLCIASLIMASHANAAMVSLTPAVNNVSVNDVITLTVEGTDFFTGSQGGGVVLSWDPSQLMVDSSVTDIDVSLAGNGWGSFGTFLDAGAGTLLVDAFSISFSGVPGPDFDVFSLDFIALDSGVLDVFTSPNNAGDNWLDGFYAGVQTDYVGASVNVVPVPAAAWLFGSGLLGLVGIARRRNLQLA